MSTRSRIGILNDDGSVYSIYCHYDGYTCGVGKCLAAHYTDPEKVRELIELGDISSLAPEIGVKHPFDNPHPYNTDLYNEFRQKYEGMVSAYGRDRGETGIYAIHSPSVQEFGGIGGVQYYYLFCDGEWLVCESYGCDKFQNLEDAIHQEARV
jgi:hypothetical protein